MSTTAGNAETQCHSDVFLCILLHALQLVKYVTRELYTTPERLYRRTRGRPHSCKLADNGRKTSEKLGSRRSDQPHDYGEATSTRSP